MHARAAEGSRDKTGRLRLAIRPKLLAGAGLDYPTDSAIGTAYDVIALRFQAHCSLGPIPALDGSTGPCAWAVTQEPQGFAEAGLIDGLCYAV